MCRALCKVPEYLSLGFSGSSDQSGHLLLLVTTTQPYVNGILGPCVSEQKRKECVYRPPLPTGQELTPQGL